MPTYEYRCPAGHDFEHFVQRISEASGNMPCPSCGAIAARKISAGGGLVFKGSGFYITDYGKDGKKDQRAATTAATSSATKGDAAAPASGADTAPAKAADAKSSDRKPSDGKSSDRKPAEAKAAAPSPPPSTGSSEK